MPVTENVYQVLEGQRSPRSASPTSWGACPSASSTARSPVATRRGPARRCVERRHGRLVDSPGRAGAARARPTPQPTRAGPARPALPGGLQWNKQLPVHLGIGHRGPPRQARRPDLRRHPRRRSSKDDPYGRVACETLVTTGLVVVAGEITTETYVDIPKIVRETISEIGYTNAALRLRLETCGVMVAIDEQSPDISQGVTQALEVRTDVNDDDALDTAGRRRPGHDVRLRLQRDAASSCRCRSRSRTSSPSGWPRCARPRSSPYLRPDGKSQVTVRYEDGKPVEIAKVVLAAQHAENADLQSIICPDLLEHVVEPILPKDLYDAASSRTSPSSTRPASSSSAAPWATAASPGARSSSTPTAAPPATAAAPSRARTRPRSTAPAPTRPATSPRTSSPPASPTAASVQVAYAIGVAHPVSVMVDCQGTEKIDAGHHRAAHRRALRPAPGGDHPRPRPAPARSTRRPPPTATSAATTTTSRGSAPTRPRRCAPPPACLRPAGERRPPAGAAEPRSMSCCGA